MKKLLFLLFAILSLQFAHAQQAYQEEFDALKNYLLDNSNENYTDLYLNEDNVLVLDISEDLFFDYYTELYYFDMTKMADPLINEKTKSVEFNCKDNKNCIKVEDNDEITYTSGYTFVNTWFFDQNKLAKLLLDFKKAYLSSQQ